MIGVSIPTLFRFAGTKIGSDGVVFPSPERITNKLFAWDGEALRHWVEVNGKVPPTKRGRPKGSTKKNKITYSGGSSAYAPAMSLSEGDD